MKFTSMVPMCIYMYQNYQYPQYQDYFNSIHMPVRNHAKVPENVQDYAALMNMLKNLPMPGKAEPSMPTSDKKAVKSAVIVPKQSFKPHNQARKDMNQAALDVSRFTASTLNQNELNRIVGLYGNSVEDIYELGAGQRWMFERASEVKSSFFLQFLIKAVIDLNPASFRQKVDEVFEKRDNLRSAFVYRNMEHPYRVVLKDRHPEINYIDLSDCTMDEFDEKIKKFMEADRRRGFDLETDSLLRMNIYKSCEKDTYAIIISQPHINSDGTSIGILFADLFLGYALDMNGIDREIQAHDYKKYAEYLAAQDIEKELGYWKDYLAGIPEKQKLPGQLESDLDFESASYTILFTEAERNNLKKAQKQWKVTQFTVLQTLWGLMLTKFLGQDEAVFGAITAGRDAGVSDSMQITGGFVNAIPVRVKPDGEIRLSELVKEIQTGFQNSLKNSHCSPGQIRKALGRKEPVFDHILNMRNFAKPVGTGFGGAGIPGIKILGGENYDNLSTDLCLFFSGNMNKFQCNYAYNARVFTRASIQLLAESFKKMLSMLEGDLDSLCMNDIPELDTALFEETQNARFAEKIRIAGILSKTNIFKGIDHETLLELAEYCKLTAYKAEDMICPANKMIDQIPIVASGMVEIMGTRRDGWSNPLKLLGPGKFLTAAALFEDVKTDVLAVSMEDSEIIYVNAEALKTYMAAYPDISIGLMKEQEMDRRAYARLWLNVE